MSPRSKASRASRDRRTPAKPKPPAPAPEIEVVASDATWTTRWPGWLVLCAGWLIPQALLLGPALVGSTIDLPLDLLVTRNIYLPDRPEYANVKPEHADDLYDLVLIGPSTVGDFQAKEFRAGRLPMWQPYNFAGTPCVASYSPFSIPYYLFPHPITLAWIAVLEALTVGLGMWLLLRRSFELSYWPSAFGSWCVPLTGFMTVWHGYSLIGPFCFLPWSMLAVGAAVKRPGGYASLGVAAVSTLTLLSGHPGAAGLVLLTTGLYALWLLADEIRTNRSWQVAMRSAGAMTLAWVLAFLLAAPYLLPLVDYHRTGARTQLTTQGFEERPPQGLSALPAIVLPDVYSGDVRANWERVERSVLPESAAGAYAGLIATFWLVPLACCDRRRRSLVIFLALLIFVSLGWTLNVPGIVEVMRSKPLQPLAALSYNRWVLATSVALVILAAIGLEYLRNAGAGARVEFRSWFVIPMFVLALFGVWCVARRLTLTDASSQQLFARSCYVGIGLTIAALIGWTAMARAVPYGKWIRLGVICLLPLELFWFAWNERRQADQALYFPRIGALERLAALPQGRIWGVVCFPPNLNLRYGLEDARGYDAVDPADYVKLFNLAVHQTSETYIPYAATQYALPSALQTASGMILHPVADLLNVRYLIFRQNPASAMPVILHEDDYWIAENRAALPRAYVPRTVEIVADSEQALRKMATYEFDPRQTAFITDKLKLPDAMKGTASIRYPVPTRSEIDAEMQTDGLVVVSDMWDTGWKATLDGEACPIYRVDEALRGFQVPAGKHQIVCTYEPQSVRTGFRAAAIGGVILLLWTLWKARGSLRGRRVTAA